jgi:hypothetical protein
MPEWCGQKHSSLAQISQNSTTLSSPQSNFSFPGTMQSVGAFNTLKTNIISRFQASATILMTSALFLDITQRQMVNLY